MNGTLMNFLIDASNRGSHLAQSNTAQDRLKEFQQIKNTIKMAPLPSG